MAQIVMYSKAWCPFCHSAKALLETKGVAIEEIDVTGDPKRETEMIRRAGGRRTVPQVFIDGRHVGGSDELHELDARGELDALLAI